MSSNNKQNILFSDIFDVGIDVIEGYGAFNVSLLGDLSLFIDPFLIFNSSKPTYQDLHEGMIKYLTFLRDKTLESEIDSGLLNALYKFSEVKQTWLGFSATGNDGRGLGKKFAKGLKSGFQAMFSEESAKITRSKHLEKVCLISEGVGKDSISDFTTNLIKEYLLRYTERFAKTHLQPDQVKKFSVPKVRFNYETESWKTMDFELPAWDDDYIILVPRDLLTRDDTWINRSDLISSFETLALAVPDEQMRASLNNYFVKRLPKDPKAEDKRKAARDTIEAYPQIIDYYIKMKEESGEHAVSISEKKVLYAKNLFLEKFTELAALVAEVTPFYSHGLTTIDDALARVECLKHAVEDHGGFKLLYSEKDRPVSAENELQILYSFLWFNSIGNAKALSIQKRDVVPVEFKLATNKNIKTYLAKKDEAAVKKEEENSDVKPEVSVVFAFSSTEGEAIEESIRSLKSKSRYVRLINAGEVTEFKEGIAMPQKHPKVFMSYSHDKEDWKRKGLDPEIQRRRVFELAERLRGEGVECVIDQQVVNPPEGWPRWMMNNIEDADFVLVVATETYNRRFRGKEEPGKGAGAQWEGAVITQELYDTNGKNEKFIPVVFERNDADHIPLPLKSATYHNVGSDEGYDELYYYLTNQPPYVPKPLGPIRKRSNS